MRYLPHTDQDISDMLKVVGAADLDDLFSSLPADCRRNDDMLLPAPLTEWELDAHMDALAGKMAVAPEYKLFLGAGSYDHHIPATSRYLLSRSEFYTAYTPYQPEISQGTLQAIYEYQTLTAHLLGMQVSNASMYDGASALAEALLMGIRIKRKKKTVAVSQAIHPLYRRVVETYFRPTEFKVVALPYDAGGVTDLTGLEDIDGLAAVAIQSPNFFGCIENIKAAADRSHAADALLITGFSEPIAYGLLKNPGSQGADIACGEGQSLGIPRSFGGPGLGIFTTTKKYVRNMPGRLIGQTTDLNGRRGYVLTLATREQHIRREKATSNICSNQGLCATAAGMFMATVGGTGLRQLAQVNHDKAEYLKNELTRAGFKIPFATPTFNEFVVEFPDGFAATHQHLLKQKIVAGLPLAPYFPELPNAYLLCATETASKEDMDRLVKEVTA